MASNLRQNIDEAFLRRIQMLVDFPFPDADQRFQIYQCTFPESVAPPPEDQIHTLAEQFRLAGGSIKNVVVDAAFRAVVDQSYGEDGRPVILIKHLVLAIAREYQKLGKPLTRGEFNADYYDWVARDILLEQRPER
jgi:SpoVK/Ycf46/Vps4 family AAA+-type ATPase